MEISDQVDKAVTIAVEAMGTSPWDKPDPAVNALEKAGFTINGPEDFQLIVNRLSSAKRLLPKAMHRGGLGAHDKAFTVCMVLSN